MPNSWDRRAVLYDLCEGSDLRRGSHKRALFERIRGRTLFVGVGTGIDIKHLPSGRGIIAIDYNRAMIEKSRQRCKRFADRVLLVQGDAGALSFQDGEFETVVTSCTMCSVPDPGKAFAELYRVLTPGGQLLMFEHVRSRNPILGPILDAMSILSRRQGTHMNRDTLLAAAQAGFDIRQVEPVFLDIILAVEARKHSSQASWTDRKAAAPTGGFNHG